MSEQSFSLVPFPTPTLPDVTITGKIAFQNHLLTLHYALAGQTDEVLLPARSRRPSRRDELWKMTCFEFFLAIKGRPQYWEFNLSPSGDWNVYHMDAYRRVGFRQEAAIQQLSFETRRDGYAFTLNTTVDLRQLACSNEPLDVGITAVIQTKESGETYWALTHPAPQADFHLRESFILELAGETHRLPPSTADGLQASRPDRETTRPCEEGSTLQR